MTKGKRIITITLCIIAIAAILFFTKADINHGHGIAETATHQTAH